jgi:hypothetical protein
MFRPTLTLRAGQRQVTIVAASRTTATAEIAIMAVIAQTNRRHRPMRTHCGKISWLG